MAVQQQGTQTQLSIKTSGGYNARHTMGGWVSGPVVRLWRQNQKLRDVEGGRATHKHVGYRATSMMMDRCEPVLGPCGLGGNICRPAPGSCEKSKLGR